MASQMPLVLKNHLPMQETIRDTGSIHGLGRSSGGGHGNPLQCSCLESLRDGGAWWAAIYGVIQSQILLKQISSSSSSSSSVPDETEKQTVAEII